jgi:hypothetical protein
MDYDFSMITGDNFPESTIKEYMCCEREPEKEIQFKKFEYDNNSNLILKTEKRFGLLQTKSKYNEQNQKTVDSTFTYSDEIWRFNYTVEYSYYEGAFARKNLNRPSRETITQNGI